MKFNKSKIVLILLFFIFFSSLGAAFSASSPSASITASYDPSDVKVGDNVTLMVTITNTGSLNLTKVLVKAKLPSGLTFLYSATGLDRNIYDPSTGIWDVGNMTAGKKGSTKSINITAKVTSSLSGQSVSSDAEFTQIYYNNTTSVVKMNTLPSSASAALTVQKETTGTGNSTGNSTNTGTSTKSTSTNKTDKKAAITDALKNATSGSGIDNLQNLNQAQGNAYEINNATTPNTSDGSRTIYYIIGGIIIAALIIVGYFKGIIG